MSARVDGAESSCHYRLAVHQRQICVQLPAGHRCAQALSPSAVCTHQRQLAINNNWMLLFSDATVSMVTCCRLVFSFRALFLGLSNNPHITDLHLDISSCEVRSFTSWSSSARLVAIPSCPSPLPSFSLSSSNS